MAKDRWPHISDQELLQLWHMHAPQFVKVEDVRSSIHELRIPFLTWLEAMEFDLSPSREVQNTRLGQRVRLDLVSFTRKTDSVQARVALSFHDVSGEAVRTGRITGEEAIRLPAEAAMEALHHVLPVVEFALDRAFVVEEPDADPIVVVVAMIPEEPSGSYVGACRITATPPEAAARAALAAMNRRAEIAASLYAPPEA